MCSSHSVIDSLGCLAIAAHTGEKQEHLEMEQSTLTDNSRQRQNNFCIYFFFTVKQNQEQSSLKGVSFYEFIILFSISKGAPTHLKTYPACHLTRFFSDYFSEIYLELDEIMSLRVISDSMEFSGMGL